MYLLVGTPKSVVLWFWPFVVFWNVLHLPRREACPVRAESCFLCWCVALWWWYTKNAPAVSVLCGWEGFYFLCEKSKNIIHVNLEDTWNKIKWRFRKNHLLASALSISPSCCQAYSECVDVEALVSGGRLVLEHSCGRLVLEHSCGRNPSSWGQQMQLASQSILLGLNQSKPKEPHVSFWALQASQEETLLGEKWMCYLKLHKTLKVAYRPVL